MSLQLTQGFINELEALCARYPKREAALLPALRLLEQEFGSVTEEGMAAVAKRIGVSPAKVYGVFTFYTHYRRPTDGKYLLQVCATLPCALRGGLDLAGHLGNRLGIRPGETTPDGLFTLKKVECLANCDKAPCLQVNDDYVDVVNPETADEIVERIRSGTWKPELPPYSIPTTKYEPILLKHVLERDSFTVDHYLARGGYKQAERVIRTMKPAEVIELVKQSGLRGRGGAGFPTGMKWGFVPAASPKPKYLICNDDESEPGTFKDKMLTERDPHRVIEGILIAAWAIQSHSAYVYIRGEFGYGAQVLRRAVDEAAAKGFLGAKCFGADYRLDVTVHRGAGAYICGEETGLITSLEGNRGYPKIKPPFPAVEGFFRSPTIVNNVETLACLPLILGNGIDWFRKFGTEKSPGTKIFCLCGHVQRPGLYELPLGLPLREMIYDLAGGLPEGRALKAVIPGGSSAAVLTVDEVDVKMDFDSLAAAKTMLGSGGVIVMDDRTCMVEALWNILRFYHHESCGQCTPCREGTGWLDKILARLETGRGRPEDLGIVLEVCDEMVGRTICVLADAAAMPAKSIVQKFRPEFEAHVAQQGCPFKKNGQTRTVPVELAAENR
ncbi:MAG: NADH-quinone oxidoreductase subunit NuoF [Planctomycetes bacterium]|nr:NADH-quinone oxidoreductase subunit NuoF [Planctomycetota bacterium]